MSLIIFFNWLYFARFLFSLIQEVFDQIGSGVFSVFNSCVFGDFFLQEDDFAQLAGHLHFGAFLQVAFLSSVLNLT